MTSVNWQPYFKRKPAQERRFSHLFGLGW